MITAAQQSIARQREALSVMLKLPLEELAAQCEQVWGDIDELEDVLRIGLRTMPHCDHLFVLNLQGIQITGQVGRTQTDRQYVGADRSARPYMRAVVPSTEFVLSDAYISEHKKRPSITAVQLLTQSGEPAGFLSAHFDLRNLPLTARLYDENRDWRQMKGDPSIRGALFAQQRVESLLDQHVETVIAVVEELMIDHGVFHCEIYFSSNRAIVWSRADPLRYRILLIEDLVDPDICLTFPGTPYPDEAVVRADQIRRVFESFRDLRFADENIYLRLGSLNIYNGFVGLTFSCDGSHSIQVDEFLEKGLAFWVGRAAAGITTLPGGVT